MTVNKAIIIHIHVCKLPSCSVHMEKEENISFPGCFGNVITVPQFTYDIFHKYFVQFLRWPVMEQYSILWKLSLEMYCTAEVPSLRLVCANSSKYL